MLNACTVSREHSFTTFLCGHSYIGENSFTCGNVWIALKAMTITKHSTCEIITSLANVCKTYVSL